MRLRRETGDFKIVATSVNNEVVYNSIPTGLLTEDLVGVVVEFEDHAYQVVTGVAPTDGANTFTLTTASGSELTYNPATGAVEAGQI